MRNILRKVPLLIWAVLLSAIAVFIVQKKWFGDLDSEQIKMLSGFLTFIGLIFVAVNIQKQWKNERIKTEYLNQPDFLLKGFYTEDLKESGPVLCPNPAECTEDHWFDLVQTGNLAARDLKVALFHIDEAEKDITTADRWLDEKRLGKGDDFQYKLPQFKIPFSLFDNVTTMRFILLLDYRSEYSGIRYKRVYTLFSSATPKPANIKENDWKGRIYFFDSSLSNTTDTDSITIKEILLNKWFKFARWSKLKKDFSYEEWIIDI